MKPLLLLGIILLSYVFTYEKALERTILPCPERRSNTELLTRKPWIIQEVYELEGQELQRYKRSHKGNTINYDEEVLQFHPGGTGNFDDIYGRRYPISWKFLTEEETEMQVVIHFPQGDVRLNYNMVQISENSFSMTFNRTNPQTGWPQLVVVKRVWQGELAKDSDGSRL